MTPPVQQSPGAGLHRALAAVHDAALFVLLLIWTLALAALVSTGSAENGEGEA